MLPNPAQGVVPIFLFDLVLTDERGIMCPVGKLAGSIGSVARLDDVDLV